MGETTVALLDAGPEALFTNPSLIALLGSQGALSVSHAKFLADTRHQAVALALRLPRGFGVCGLSANRLDLGEMVETVNADPDNPGGAYVVRGTYTADALAVGLSYANHPTAWFAWGFTIRYVRERVAMYASRNLLFDGGMVYITGFRSLRIGGYLQNFGVDSRYIGDSFKMPMVFRLGMAMEIFGDANSPSRLTVAADALHPSDYSERLHVGGEWWMGKRLALRAGYKFNYDEQGLALGGGLRWQIGDQEAGFDLAYSDYHRLHSVLRMTFSLVF